MLRKTAEQLLQLRLVLRSLDVADDEGGAPPRRPPAGAEAEDPVAGESVLDVLGRAKHRPAEWMLAEGRLVDQMLGQHGRLIVSAGDLLGDDSALAVHLLLVDAR